VYLELPTDRVFNKIPRGRLDTPLTRAIETADLHVEEFVLDGIQKLVEKAGSDVVILIDACTIRHDVVEEVWDLIQRTGFPVYSAPMGKTAVAEDYERFGGVRYLCFMAPRLGADVTNRFTLVPFLTQKSRKRSKVQNFFSPLVGLDRTSILAISHTAPHGRPLSRYCIFSLIGHLSYRLDHTSYIQTTLGFSMRSILDSA
jgi:hypothetical protein